MHRLTLLGGGSGTAGGGGGGGGPIISYIGTMDVAIPAAIATFTNQAIGTPASDRLVVVLIGGWRAGLARTLSSVTIGGNAATIHLQQTNTGGSAGPTLAIASLVVATGTTATIVATYSSGEAQATSHVYTITGLNSTTPVATNSAAVASGDPSTTVNVTGTGVAVALWSGTTNTTGPATFTGLSTKDYDAVVGGTAVARVASAHQGGLATETPRTISVTSANTIETIVAATWH